ncbi:unnamed protein product, partial [Dibothriocephalus latus]
MRKYDCPSIRGYNVFPPPRSEADDEDEDSARVSLLPWLNASWIELTP